jgi:Rrf2 family protein
MINLSLRFQDGVVQIKEVAERENISIKYLEHIASILKTSGLIKVERGVKGGYYLAKKPREINAREMMEALEGDLNLIDRPEGNAKKEKPENGSMTDFWKDFSNHIKSYLENITLEQLTIAYKKNNKDFMYYI